MWGRFSDRYGRRPALIVGMSASAIAYVIFAYVEHALAAVPVAPRAGRRAAERSSVIQAYVADAVEPEQRAKGLGWLSAATNAGVALGPVIGSRCSTFGPHGAGARGGGAVRPEHRASRWRYLVESRDMVEARVECP